MLRHTLLRSRSLVACATRRAPLISGVGVAPAVCARHAARRLHAARPTADGALANDTPAAAVEHDAAGASATHAANSFDPAALTGLLLDLHSRGMLAALTNPREMIRHLSGDQPRVIYAGFDPTAESLHIGNLLVLMVLRRCQKWGHKPICLVGGATGMIGDPSGRSSERQMLTEAQLDRNIAGISKDIQKFLDFEASPSSSSSSSSLHSTPFNSLALLLNNASWFSPLHVIPFFRDVGRHFRMGAMLAKDSVSSRLSSESGMSFTEFTYQVLQAYDFMHLYRTHGVSVQIGGTDQWGNITAGVDLIKRDAAAASRASGAADDALAPEPQVFGLTLPLLTTSTGQKFGKSMGNAPIWLAAPTTGADATSTASTSTSSPYQLYQYFLSTADADVVRYMRLFTDYSLEEIAALETEFAGVDNQRLCRLLAEAVTRLVHGEAGLAQARASTAALFGGEALSADQFASIDEFLRVFVGVPQLRVPRATIVGRSIVDVAVQVGLAKTRGEVKRLVASGGLYLNNAKVATETHALTDDDLVVAKRVCLLRSGKKKQFVVIVDDDAGA